MTDNKTTTKSISGIDIMFVDNSPLSTELTVEEQKEIEKIDSLPEVSPCDISQEHCELVAKQKERAEKLIKNITKKKYLSNYKSEEIRIRVTEEEKDNITERADEYGFVNLSDFIRVALLNCKITVNLDSKTVPRESRIIKSKILEVSDAIYDVVDTTLNQNNIEALINVEDDIECLGKLISAANNTISKLNSVVSNCNAKINQKLHKNAEIKIQENIDLKKGKGSIDSRLKFLIKEWEALKSKQSEEVRNISGNNSDILTQKLKTSYEEIRKTSVEVDADNSESMIIEPSDFVKTNILISDPKSDIGITYPKLEDESHIHGDI